jgi:hypothetical protein
MFRIGTSIHLGATYQFRTDLSQISFSVRASGCFLAGFGEREIELLRLEKPARNLDSGLRCQFAEFGAFFSRRFFYVLLHIHRLSDQANRLN